MSDAAFLGWMFDGLDEIFALIDVKTHVESGNYDMLVVDCAPTAETLRLLALPEALDIRKAERQLAAATARIGVAGADVDRLPPSHGRRVPVPSMRHSCVARRGPFPGLNQLMSWMRELVT